ncbi:SDR family NAD(P)-dependent oxidoreductase [Caballeronia sordidicola]|uniref:SDR family NAD(P)-dependent oxidoreductase n=1 Tax=Caballeronia sordidicola TaxID=196367 RepID=UPI00117C4A67|nr:SDR family NAD(P)-dependent oxidoreductase [Caballeronia sordidicola]
MHLKTIVIVGAGPGLGLAIAKRFGKEGYRVALIARRAESLSSLTTTLTQASIESKGYVADVTDEESLERAFVQIKIDFGSIDILEYSPLTRVLIASSAVDTNAARLAFNSYYLGAVACVQRVLPSMRERGLGTILLTLGQAPKHMMWKFGSAAPMAAALRTYALSLNTELDSEGIYVACGTVRVQIDAAWAEKIADTYWTMHVERTSPETVVEHM